MQRNTAALLPIATAKADISRSSCLLCLQKGTCAVHLAMSAKGHKRTFGFRVRRKTSGRIRSATADVSLHMRCTSDHLRPRPLAALAVEAPLPPDPHLVVSGELCVHLEIRAH